MSDWTNQAISIIEADFRRSADTHLLKVELPAIDNIDLYLKDESTHPTGSLKHRLARSLFLYCLCNGLIARDTTIIESSSGSTAVSEAYFAKLLGLRFIAVVPKSTSQEKIDKITFYDGQCHFVEPGDIYAAAARLADELNGHYMDQFTYAERATDWRGNNNIAESIFAQMSRETFPDAILDCRQRRHRRHLRDHRAFHPLPVPCHATMRCRPRALGILRFVFKRGSIADFATGFKCRRHRPAARRTIVYPLGHRSHDQGTGCGFLRDHTFSATGMLDRRCGGSTGTNVYAAFEIIAELNAAGESGSVVSMLCDGGERYLDSYYNDEWLTQKGFDLGPYQDATGQFLRQRKILTLYPG